MFNAAAPVIPRALATTAALVVSLMVSWSPTPARAQDDAVHGGSASLRLTSPGGGLWWRERAFGLTPRAESASLGSTNDPSWRLLGSYDLPKATGLRASGGMIGVSRRTAFGGTALQENQRWDNGLTSGWIEGTRVSDPAAQAQHISVPYAGIGYSTASASFGPKGLVSSAWSFNVDLGVMALAPRSAVRFGSALTGQSQLDDMLRELRLSPLLQLGVSYSF